MFIPITGVPGVGKTSTTIRILTSDPKYFERPRYYHNVYLFLLDFELLCSFAGFIGDYVDTLSKSKRKPYMEALARIKCEGRNPDLEDFPNLQKQFESYSPQRTFYKWVKRCYPKSQLKRLDEVIKVSGWDFHFKNIQHLNLHFTHLEDPRTWPELPPKSILFQDEAQEVYPLRPAGSPIPLWVSAYEKHRHKSVDIFAITQDVTMIDVHLRKLVGQHWFLGDTDLSKVIYKRRGGIITKGKADKPFNHDESGNLPSNKKIYGVYYSSPEDTHSKKLPFKFVALCAFATALIVGAAYSGYNAVVGQAIVSDDTSPPDSSTQAPVDQSSPAPQKVKTKESNSFLKFGRDGREGRQNTLKFETPQEFLQQITPVVPDIPFTAPAYQHLLEVNSFPRPQCIVVYRNHDEEQKECKCYTQQATPLDISESSCLAYVEDGYFDFTRPDPSTRRNRQSRVRGKTEKPSVAARASTS